MLIRGSNSPLLSQLLTSINLKLYTMDYLEQNIQKYYANEITLEELKKVLHFLIDDIVVPDAIYTKNKMDKGE
jgi:hypothetical protein